MGAWTNDGSGALDLKISLSEAVGGVGSGYGIDFLAGVDPPAGAFAPMGRSTVPEPDGLSVLGFGLMVLGWLGLRRRRAGLRDTALRAEPRAL